MRRFSPKTHPAGPCTACLWSYQEARSSAQRMGYPEMLKTLEDEAARTSVIAATTPDSRLRGSRSRPRLRALRSSRCSFVLVLGTFGCVRWRRARRCDRAHGRDCSTQLRFQKIFVEGPPTIAATDTSERPRTALRLARSVRYRGAGTVEHLYKLETKPSASLSSTHVCRWSTLWPRAALA